MRVLATAVLICAACSTSNVLPPEAWSTEDYARAGITIDKPWTPHDFVNAQTVLAREAANHRERLPRFRGAKSGAVFAKLLSAPLDNTERSIDDRFPEHGYVFQALNMTSKLYIQSIVDVPPREWIELMGAMLREARLLAGNVDAYLLSTIGTDDRAKHAVRLDGVEKMKQGYGGMILGGLMSAGDTRISEADRTALVEHITAALPVLFPFVPAQTQNEIRAQIDRLVDGLPKGRLHDAVVAAKRALP